MSVRSFNCARRASAIWITVNVDLLFVGRVVVAVAYEAKRGVAINEASFRDAPPNSGLPEFGNIIVQVGNSRLGGAGPESILPIVVMDSGLARFTRAPE